MRAVAAAALLMGSTACGEPPHVHPDDEAAAPFAVEVVSFSPGEGAGFGADAMPDVVLGGPHGGTAAQGSTDVVSLGVGGTIVLRLGLPATDGDGPDLLVFENPFAVGSQGVFGEPGEVSVSADGDAFATFPCTPDAEPPNGCAGYGVVHAAADDGPAVATDPTTAGGDAFDLTEVGLVEASFVRILDRSTAGGAPSAGFDLDAVAAVAR